MSDGISVSHIKQEVDTSSATSNTIVGSSIGGGGANSNSSYSPATPSSSLNRSNSCSSSTKAAHNSKSSPSVSPERQLCSSTTSLSCDLHNVTLNNSGDCTTTTTIHQHNKNIDSGGSAGGASNGSGSIRDELRRLCLVCGDVASGFHYGVASCEACKAFFKRTIQGNIEYTCPANNECEINKRRRKACQACRFQKCLLMGMLKEGVRLDRVRGGRQKYRRNPVSNSYQTMQLLYQSNTTSLGDIKILEVLNSCEPETLCLQKLQQQQQQRKNNSSTTTTGTTSASGSTSTSTLPTTSSPSSSSTTSHNNNSSSNNNDDTSDTQSSSIKLESGTSTPTNNQQTLCIFHNNNNDPCEILSGLSDLYDKELVCVIGWAKQLPGFTELPLDDQIKLLQVSWAEILTLQLTFRSLPFNGKLCFANDVWMDELLAKECGYTEFYYHCVQIAQRLERISPRREEYYLLKALLLSNCDILLDDQSSLRAFRETILNALNDVVYLLRHSAAVSHQQQLLLVLPSLRQADDILRRFWRGIKCEYGIRMRKLFVEMLEPVAR